MNSIALERSNLLLTTLTLAAVIGVSIPTFAFAQTSTTNYYGPAPAISRSATLNGSVTQSKDNGSSNGMRMMRGQAAGGSLFSSDAMSSFSQAPANTPAPAQSFQQPPQTPQIQQFSQPVQQAAARQDSDFDVSKAIGIGSTVLHGFNQFMNATRPVANTLYGSNQMTDSLLNRPTFSGATTASAFPPVKSLLNFSRPLNRTELSMLSNYDVAVIIDRSGSMEEHDCPSGLSRWDFCREQMLNLTNQTSSAFRSGITVALFSSGYRIFNNVNFGAVSQIFADNGPDGGTYLSRPLKEILNSYFDRRDSNSGNRVAVRPLLVEVITDGDPSDKEGVIQAICEATQKMSNPGEVTIQFLQIGQENEGDRILEHLDNRLVSQDGAQYDIVRVEPFSQIVNEGLARSLVNAATRRSI